MTWEWGAPAKAPLRKSAGPNHQNYSLLYQFQPTVIIHLGSQATLLSMSERSREGEPQKARWVTASGDTPQMYLHVGEGKHHFPTGSGRVLEFTPQGTTTQTISLAGIRKPISQHRELRHMLKSGALSQESEKSHHPIWIGF